MSLTRPFSTKPQLKEPPGWIFFTDRDLGKALPNALRKAGYKVEMHDDHFLNTRTRDDVWLPEVAKRGWIALSHDKHIRRVKEERDAAMQAGLALFFLIGKRHEDVISNVVATAPKIIRFREKHLPPFIAHVIRPPSKFAVGTRPGEVKVKLTKEEWEAR
jgi:PIN like domain